MKHFRKFRIRLNGWIKLRLEIAVAVKIRYRLCHRREKVPKCCQKEEKRTVGQLFFFAWNRPYLFKRSNFSLRLQLWNSSEFLRKRYFDLGSELPRLRFEGPNKVSWIPGQLLFCLEPFAAFLHISPGLKLGNRISRIVIEKVLLKSAGLWLLFSLFEWVSSKTRVIFLITSWMVVLVCYPIPVATRKFLTTVVSLL